MIGGLASQATPALARKKNKKPEPKKPDPLFATQFRRRDRDGWGPPWFNQRYGRRWMIKDQKAIFKFPPPENDIDYRPCPVLVLDHDVSNVDIRATLSSSNPTTRMGLVARADDYARYYAVYLGPWENFRIVRCGHHGDKVLKKRKVSFTVGRRYRIRLQVRGRSPVRLRAKIWRAGSPQPLRWTLEATDDTQGARVGKGAFGIFAQHAGDLRGGKIRVFDFVARSKEKPSASVPSIAYALAGPPATGGAARLIAKTAVPASVRFEVGPEPTLTQGVTVVGPIETIRGAQTARGRVDLGDASPSSIVYWRAVARRGEVEVLGPTSSFRTGPRAGFPVRFAFGSCTKWEPSPRQSFKQARLKLPDFYLHQGDFGYVGKHVIDHAPDTYQDHWVRMLMDPHLQELAREMPFSFYQDDADYGYNMANRHTLRRFSIAAFDDLHANPPGPYFEFRYGDLAVFSIECRRYSTGNELPMNERTRLGRDQTKWLKERMRAAAEDESVGLLIVASPMAFGSDFSPESWRKGYAAEWSDLIDFFQSLEAPVLIASGNVHGHRLHEYPQKNIQPGLPRIVEFVSSGTEATRFFKPDDLDNLVKKARGSGFGLVELGAEQEVEGQRSRTLTLSALKSSDGTPLWRQEYVIVRGVGIFPVGV